MSEELLRKKYIELQLYEAEIKEIQNKLQGIDEQITEIGMIRKSLEDMQEVEDKSEILIPIANGIFAKAKFQKEDNVKINIGNNSVRDYTYDEAANLLERQAKDITNIRNSLVDQFESLIGQMQILQSELLKISGQTNQESGK